MSRALILRGFCGFCIAFTQGKGTMLLLVVSGIFHTLCGKQNHQCHTIEQISKLFIILWFLNICL